MAASVAAVLIVIGITQLRRNRLAAFRWFDRALLIRILVVQVFLFQEQQSAATLGLFVDLFVWAMLRSAIVIEEQRLELELELELEGEVELEAEADAAGGPPAAPGAAPTGDAPAEATGPDARS
ncbi:MAG: hypothetical protein FJW95_04420 [Actinobacteria bacterium]|nr:hypothetical protein [Actinomycetota bacterium]